LVIVTDLWKVTAMKRKRTGFTLVELLTVLAIITMLVGLLVPSMATVRRFARETKQRAQLTTMDLALTAFRGEYGEYPESSFDFPLNYCGAQKLAEALLGWDLLGFHPDSDWRADGLDETGGPLTYDPLRIRDVDGDGIFDTLNERKGPYLEDGTANAFRLGVSAPGMDDGLFLDTSIPSATLDPDTFVICDVFGVRRLTLPNGRTVTAGTPILYYRANTSSRTLQDSGLRPNYIYNAYDNSPLVGLRMLTPDGSLGRPHKLYDGAPVCEYFYSPEYKILDPKASSITIPWPHRPDSYILISAGVDGEYGTADDITNFGD
jgi:prepilin-type N-terminal cleavage/methylation domain-containing protein